MPYYESVFIARQDITAAQADALGGEFSKIIEDHSGKVASVERWGLRSLAYRIKKNRKGHYILLGIDAPSEAVHEMERQMRLNEDVIRHMTVRVDALDKTPSQLAQVGTDRHASTDRPVNVVKDVKSPKIEGDKPARDNVEAKGDETVEAKEPDAAAEDVKGDDK